MNSQVSTRALFLAGMVFASSAFATDINKCVTASGSVTLTDEACPGSAQTVKVLSTSAAGAGTDETTPLAARPSIERYTLPRAPVHYATLVRSPQAMHSMAPDIATLKVARANMHLFDSAAQSMRSQRIAGLQ